MSDLYILRTERPRAGTEDFQARNGSWQNSVWPSTDFLKLSVLASIPNYLDESNLGENKHVISDFIIPGVVRHVIYNRKYIS